MKGSEYMHAGSIGVIGWADLPVGLMKRHKCNRAGRVIGFCLSAAVLFSGGFLLARGLSSRRKGR